MIHRINLAGAALAAIVAASPALAGPAQDFNVHRVSVAYGDLDLSTAAGRSALEARVDAAAAQACGGSPAFATGYRDAPQFYRNAFAHCLNDARHQAVTMLQRQGVRVAQR